MTSEVERAMDDLDQNSLDAVTGFPLAGSSVKLAQGPFFQGAIERLDHRQQSLMHHELFRFLNSELRSKVSYSIKDEYPAVFGEFPGGISLLIRSENRIVAHAAFLVRQ